MSVEVFLALVSFAFAAAMTPGPNNVMLTASGVNFGFVRTIPHMVGVALGFATLLAAAGLGLGTLFVAWPQAQAVLKTVGAAYLLWLAWKIASAAGIGAKDDAAARPLTMLQGALFQWVNPKGIVATLGAIALFVRPDRMLSDLVVLILVFTAATSLAVVTWTAFGAGLRRFLRDPVKIRVFNVTMALLLVASIVPMVWM